MSSQLIDMGKIGLPDSIIQKEGKYTPDEFDIMKQHTLFAADSYRSFHILLPNSPFITYMYQMTRSHHEQWCGRGYPDGLRGNEIPQLARIRSSDLPGQKSDEAPHQFSRKSSLVFLRSSTTRIEM